MWDSNIGRSRADTMQRQVLSYVRGKRDEVVFDRWLKSGLSPEEVYHMMPFALEKPFHPPVERREARWRSLCRAISSGCDMWGSRVIEWAN